MFQQIDFTQINFMQQPQNFKIWYNFSRSFAQIQDLRENPKKLVVRKLAPMRYSDFRFKPILAFTNSEIWMNRKTFKIIWNSFFDIEDMSPLQLCARKFGSKNSKFSLHCSGRFPLNSVYIPIIFSGTKFYGVYYYDPNSFSPPVSDFSAFEHMSNHPFRAVF